MAEWWYRATALEDLLEVATESVYDERLYRTLDRVLPHKQAIEAHLVERLGELFELDYGCCSTMSPAPISRGSPIRRSPNAATAATIVPTACR